MEKTYTESALEGALIALGMPFEPRIYSDEIRSAAEIDDIEQPKRVNTAEDMLLAIFGKHPQVSYFQELDSQNNSLFVRISRITHGLGLEYHLCSKSLVTRKEINQLIKNRSYDYESVSLCIKKGVDQDAQINFFNESYPLLSYIILPNGDVKVENFDSVLAYTEEEFRENYLKFIGDEDLFDDYQEFCIRITEGVQNRISQDEILNNMIEFLAKCVKD